MELHQIQLTYQQDEDRILVRVTFNRSNAEPLEFRAWFTRRFVKALWPGITATMQAQVIMDQPQMAHVSAEIANMENQAAVNEIRQQGNFDIPFEAPAHQYPLGEMPILVTDVQFTLNANQPVRIHLSDARKTGLELQFSQTLLHGFCTLLQQAVHAAEWDMELNLPGAFPSEGSERVLN
jgi:hypothetical protein